MMLPQPLLLLAATAHDGGDADLPPTEPPDLRSKPLVLVKVWCLVIVFVATFLAGVSPYLVKWNDGFILLGSQFAGGVFLGTALMQFLSDSDENFDSLIDKDYPFAFMLASFGYLLAMLSDCIVLYAYRRRRGNDHGSVLQQRESSSGAGPSQPDIQVDHPTSNLLLLFSAISFGDSVLLLIALCFHAIFEGIGIGIGIGMADAKPRAWRALWTVTLHKAFAAMSMGMTLLRTIPENPLFSCIAYAFAFAISTPVGVAIGIVMDAATPGVAGAWIYAMFMSLTCGVFVYISVNHLLFKGYYYPKGEVSMDRPPHRFLAAVLGVGVVAIVMIWDTSPHRHAYGSG
ncbi:zinc transporter 11-like isoform X2 [Diospyros lotus]|uniref:zinc transporter 11-like isoform X2 n=1 Tax=Diospyros lotus TaxID=55363 RepID=UPI0022590CAD|nr:zinc transporter 11-like isoform X2 [Diospyros lotus]